MKTVQVIFKNPAFNFCTDCNPKASNEGIEAYFLNGAFNVGSGEDHLEVPLKVRFMYKVVAGSFEGERGYIDLNSGSQPLIHLHASSGEVLAVTKRQIEQVI